GVVLGLDAHVGGALARGQRQTAVQDGLGLALLPYPGRGVRDAQGVDQLPRALALERRRHVLARHHGAGDQDLAQLLARRLLLLQRVEELADGDLLGADQDVAQPVAAPPQRVQLVLEPVGRARPELLLVEVAGGAEAAEAERAELGGVLGVVRAPDGGERIELAEAIPAGDVVGLERAASACDHPRGSSAINPWPATESLPAFPPCGSVEVRSLWRKDCTWSPPPACARRLSTRSTGRAAPRWCPSAAGTCPSSIRA